MMPAKNFRKLRGPANVPLEPALPKKEQSNTSITYGDRLILKMFRRLQEGVNPDLEISRFITERTEYPAHAEHSRGSIEFHKDSKGSATLGILQSWVRNEGDAWTYTLDTLSDYFEHCLARSDNLVPPVKPPGHLLDHLNQEVPELARETIGPYLGSAGLLGQRTGELHMALASDRRDPDFTPEAFTPFYRRSLYQSLRTSADRADYASARSACRFAGRNSRRRGTNPAVEEPDPRAVSTGRRP